MENRDIAVLNSWTKKHEILGTLYKDLLSLHSVLPIGLIDYNFHCFRKAIQEVFEIRSKLTAGSSGVMATNSTDLGAHGQNGLPPVPTTSSVPTS